MKPLLTIFCLLGFLTASAELSKYDLNAPMGWATCNSLTTAGDYELTGGGSGRTITLKASGGDDYSAIKNAISNYDVIVLDGSAGDFVLSQSVYVTLSNRTIVGINNARLCTKFYVTPEIAKLMDDNNVKSLSGASGTGGTLSNGVKVNEAGETKVRQLLIDYTGDSSEAYRRSGFFTFAACSNIIVRNLDLVGPGAIDVGGHDLISINQSAHHIWVDHCRFTDGMDGNLDITVKADFVTVSWCEFRYTERSYNHCLSNLVAGSEDPNTQGRDNLNITYVNNIWGPGCEGRMPMTRFGTIHLLNNYYNCAGSGTCMNPREEAEFCIEANYFAEGVQNIFSQHEATSYEFWDNYYTEEFKQPANHASVLIPYDYRVYDVMEVPEVLSAAENGAGPTLSDPLTIGRPDDELFQSLYRLVYKVNEEVYHVDYLAPGDSIHLMAPPTDIRGYHFLGWETSSGDVPATMPAEKLEINGQFGANVYALRYHVQDELYAIDSVAYQEKIQLRDIPEIEGASFSEWSIRQELSEDDYKASAAQVNNELAGIVSGGAMIAASTVLARTDEVVMKTGSDDGYKPTSVTSNGFYQAMVGEAVLNLDIACQGSTNPTDASGGQCDKNLTPPAIGAFLTIDVYESGYLYIFHRGSSNKTYLVSEEGNLMGYEFAMHTVDAPWGDVLTYTMEGDEGQYITDASKLMWPEKIVLGDAWSQAAGDDGKVGINGVAVIKFPVKEGLHYTVNACASKITCAGFIFSNADQDVMIASNDNQQLLLEVSQDNQMTVPTRMPAHDLDLYASMAVGMERPQTEEKQDVYNIHGRLLYRQVYLKDIEDELPQGLYLINKKKIMIK